MTEPVPPNPEPKQHTRSLSQLQSYSRCSEQFRLERLEKAPRQPAAWLAQGTALHEALEQWEKSFRQIPVEQIIAKYHEAYEREIDKLLDEWPDYSEWLPDGIKKTMTSIEDRRAIGEMHVRTFIADATAQQWRIWELPDGSPGVEIGFRVEFGGVPVVGFIDSVMQFGAGQVAPLDYKSKDSETDTQLGLYALVLRELFDAPATHGYYWRGQLTPKRKNQDESERRPKGLTDPIDLTRYTREYFEGLFASLDRGISQKVFLPNPGQHCRVCPVQRSCTAVARNRLEG